MDSKEQLAVLLQMHWDMDPDSDYREFVRERQTECAHTRLFGCGLCIDCGAWTKGVPTLTRESLPSVQALSTLLSSQAIEKLLHKIGLQQEIAAFEKWRDDSEDEENAYDAIHVAYLLSQGL